MRPPARGRAPRHRDGADAARGRGHAALQRGHALARRGARAALRHMGASPRRHLRSCRGVARARGAGAPAPPHQSPRYLRRLRAGPPRRTSSSWSGSRRPSPEAATGAAWSCAVSGASRTRSCWTSRGARCRTPRSRRPVRFLPVWDATLLVHAPPHRHPARALRPEVFNTKTPQSVPTFTVDGQVAGPGARRRAKCSSSRRAAAEGGPPRGRRGGASGWHSSSHERTIAP